MWVVTVVGDVLAIGGLTKTCGGGDIIGTGTNVGRGSRVKAIRIHTDLEVRDLGDQVAEEVLHLGGICGQGALGRYRNTSQLR